MSQELANWIASLPNTKDIRQVEVILGTLVFRGVRYTSVQEYTSGMQIVTDGKVKAGDKYERDRIELLGEMPYQFKNRSKFCFPFECQDWYIGCYYQKNDKNEYHPFGKCFSLFPWDAPNSKIDDYERVRYLRVPMTVSYCT